MGSPLYNFLGDSILFVDSEIASDFATVPEDRLAEELDAYLKHAAACVAEIEAGLRQQPGVLTLATGAALRPVQMLTQGAFYVERIVMDDPMFAAAASWHANQLSARELYKVDPPHIERRQIASVATYLKRLTPMVAANYVILMPVNRMHGFADEVLPLPPQFHIDLIPPAAVWDLLRSRVQVGPVRESASQWPLFRSNSGAAVSVSFNGYPSMSWGRTSSAVTTIPFIPSSEDVLAILHRASSHEQLTAFERLVVEAVEYSGNAIYKQIMGDVGMAIAANASYATEAPLAYELLDIMGNPAVLSDQYLTGRATIDVKIPFLARVDMATLMNLRLEDRGAFQAFRHTLEIVLQAIGEASSTEERERLLRDLNRQADDEMERLARISRRQKKALALSSVVTAGSVMGAQYDPSVLSLVTAGLSLILKAWEGRTAARENDWFFLWKVGQRHA